MNPTANSDGVNRSTSLVLDSSSDLYAIDAHITKGILAQRSARLRHDAPSLMSLRQPVSQARRTVRSVHPVMTGHPCEFPPPVVTDSHPKSFAAGPLALR